MVILPSSPGIYKITCTANHKVYIGSTTDLRKRKLWHWADLRIGRHHNRHLQNAWNKYDENSFTFEVLETTIIVECLHEREQYWLDYHQASDPKKGFNAGKIARAPWLGRSHSEETRQKLSDNAKRRDNIGHARQYADEWHGSDEGRQWHGAHAKQLWKDRQPTTLQCEQCDTLFETRATHRCIKYCSNRCRAAARRSRRADFEARVCLACGQLFSCNKYLSTQTCSSSCASRLRTRDEKGQFL